MKEEKNHVGRPTNEEVKIRRNKKLMKVFIPIVAIFVIAFGIYTFISNNSNTNKLKGASSTELTHDQIRKQAKEKKAKYAMISEINFQNTYSNGQVSVKGDFKIDSGYSFVFADVWFNGTTNKRYVKPDVLIRPKEVNFSVKGNEKFTTSKSDELSIRFYYKKGNKYYTDSVKKKLNEEQKKKFDYYTGQTSYTGGVLRSEYSNIRTKAKERKISVNRIREYQVNASSNSLYIKGDWYDNIPDQNKYLFADVWFVGTNKKVCSLTGYDEFQNSSVSFIKINSNDNIKCTNTDKDGNAISMRIYYTDGKNYYYAISRSSSDVNLKKEIDKFTSGLTAAKTATTTKKQVATTKSTTKANLSQSDIRKIAKEKKPLGSFISTITVGNNNIKVSGVFPLKSNEKFLFADVWFGSNSNRLFRILGTSINKNKLSSINFGISKNTYSTNDKSDSLAIRFYYTDGSNYYTFPVRKNLTNKQRNQIDNAIPKKSSNNSSNTNSSSNSGNSKKADSAYLDLICPGSAIVNQQFRCSTSFSGVKLEISRTNLASGYSSSWTTTSSDKTIKAKYTKSGTIAVTASKSGKYSKTAYINIINENDLAIDCPKSAKINTQFVCTTPNVGATFSLPTSGLANGYQSSLTTSNGNMLIKAKYTKIGSVKITLKKGSKTVSRTVTVTNDGSEGGIKKGTK